MTPMNMLRNAMLLSAASAMIACSGGSTEEASNGKANSAPLPGLPVAESDGTGRLMLFQDYRSLGRGFTGHYGPANGVGFDAEFMADVYYSVWTLDDVEIGGARLSEKRKTVPLNPSGLSLEAAYQGPAPDVAATCIIHPTPKSNGRKALIMQFWRAVPERADRTTGAKSYDEAAPALVGWADAEYPCAVALHDIGDARASAVWGPKWREAQDEARKTLD